MLYCRSCGQSGHSAADHKCDICKEIGHRTRRHQDCELCGSSHHTTPNHSARQRLRREIGEPLVRSRR
jgi:hypothetical protein